MELFQKENLKLVKTDCFDLLRTIDDDSIDLIATDPPYYKVIKDDWDRQWLSESDYFAWLERVLVELARILKPTGSLYLFAGPHLATKVENVVSNNFAMLNHIVWRKPSGRHMGCCKETLRRYFPQTEHILFAESKKPVPFAFDSIRAYLHLAILDAGISQKQVDDACGCQMSGHWFGKSQWHMISEKHYQTLNDLVGGSLKPYVEIYQEYRHILNESNAARRTFNVTKHVPFTNVWDYKPVQPYPGKHPCEKPMDLMKHIVTTSSLPGDVVCDPFAGSATTAIACHETDRRFIGSEMGKDEFSIAAKRLASLNP